MWFWFVYMKNNTHSVWFLLIGLQGREVTLACSYRRTCFVIKSTRVNFYIKKKSLIATNLIHLIKLAFPRKRSVSAWRELGISLNYFPTSATATNTTRQTISVCLPHWKYYSWFFFISRLSGPYFPVSCPEFQPRQARLSLSRPMSKCAKERRRSASQHL